MNLEQELQLFIEWLHKHYCICDNPVGYSSELRPCSDYLHEIVEKYLNG